MLLDIPGKHMTGHAPRNCIKTDCEKKTCIAIIYKIRGQTLVIVNTRLLR